MTNSQRTVTVPTKACPLCMDNAQITVPLDQYNSWKNGAFVQDAFPDLSAEERELLISGTHPDCWSQIFGEL